LHRRFFASPETRCRALFPPVAAGLVTGVRWRD
jgi:hypothetical protein